MTALLVLYICSNGMVGCDEAQKTYLHQNPIIQTSIDNTTRKVENILPRFLVKKISPVLAAALKKEITIPVNKYVSITQKQSESSMTLTLGY